MNILEFYKVQASGNDFILIDNRKLGIKTSRLKEIARNYCRRRLGVGADGLLAIESSKKALFKMRIFNPDGSEAQMCGNGARSSALWYNLKNKKAKAVNFETKAGIIKSHVENDRVKINLTDPRSLEEDIALMVLGRRFKANFLNTGVPHTVIFVQGLSKIDVEKIGRAVRFHHEFRPNGTNVNFVELVNDNFIKVRTYERGVENETLACGSGAVAAALITALKLRVNKREIKVLTRGNELLKVYFAQKGKKFTDVWLSGKVSLVYKGVIYV